jgi:hypothetical protein
MVNYQVINNNILKIHDGLNNADYCLANWQSENYYHFWLDGEQVKRRYIVLQDNREQFLSFFHQSHFKAF